MYKMLVFGYKIHTILLSLFVVIMLLSSYFCSNCRPTGIIDGFNNKKQMETESWNMQQGQMLMFANTPFKPECCPNTYSNSSGCACLTNGQYNHLVNRGGNNVPFSEY